MRTTVSRIALRRIIKKRKPQLRLAANADLLVRKETGGGEARPRLVRERSCLWPRRQPRWWPRDSRPQTGTLLPKCSGLCALEHFGCEGIWSYC